MASYKVIALSLHCDKVQRVFNSGDIISDDQLHDGQGPKLVADGFLEEIVEAPAEETPPPPPPAEESAASKAGKSRKA